jgi:hypothetical protein
VIGPARVTEQQLDQLLIDVTELLAWCIAELSDIFIKFPLDEVVEAGIGTAVRIDIGAAGREAR